MMREKTTLDYCKEQPLYSALEEMRSIQLSKPFTDDEYHFESIADLKGCTLFYLDSMRTAELLTFEEWQLAKAAFHLDLCISAMAKEAWAQHTNIPSFENMP